MLALAPDRVDDVLMQRERRLQQRRQLRGLSWAGELAKHLMDVAADRRVGGEQAEVGVQARGARVVVAGRQMHVRSQPPLLAPHDHQHLGVRLVADDAVDHVRPHLFEARGPVDVRLLVEARHQLHHHGHRFAVARRLDQRFHQRRLRAGAIDGLFDRYHGRIGRRRARELEHRLKRLVRVMQQNVAGSDRREHVGALGARHARCERGEFQIRAIHQIGDLTQPHQIHRPFYRIQIDFVELELAHQELAHRARAARAHLETDGAAEVSVEKLTLQRGAQILDLLLVDE